jgi:hypothetical protein
MRRVNTFFLFTLGKYLAPLHDIEEEGATYGRVFWALANARVNVQTLLNNEVITIRTCRQAANQLVAAITDVVPTDWGAAINHDKGTVVEWWNLSQIKDAAKKFETVLAEELNILDTYAVAQKGAYSTSELIANAEVIFPEGIRAKLPEQTIQDIREAGKCLAFETPTASAFHIVRAIESVILAYYKKVTGKNPPTRMRNWGLYIKALRGSGKADTKIVDFLDHIKDNYRNPVSHPEAVLSVEEVLVLLGVASSAITQMALSL